MPIMYVSYKLYDMASNRIAELLEALEDRYDVEMAREALAESDERVPWEAIKKRLAL